MTLTKEVWVIEHHDRNEKIDHYIICETYEIAENSILERNYIQAKDNNTGKVVWVPAKEVNKKLDYYDNYIIITKQKMISKKLSVYKQQYNYETSKLLLLKRDKNYNSYMGLAVLIAVDFEEWRNLETIQEKAFCSEPVARKHLKRFIRNNVVITKKIRNKNTIYKRLKIYYKIKTKNDENILDE